jgi:hypothetical protein
LVHQGIACFFVKHIGAMAPIQQKYAKKLPLLQYSNHQENFE